MSSTNFFTQELSEDEIKRLDRQLRLPKWNQVALKKSVVLIAGVGGLGCEIAKNLAMAGVGTLILVDMDTIEYSNLNRQILFYDAKEGTPKAVAAAESLKKINPHGNYVAYHSSLQELNPEVYEQADLYIAGLDSMNARLELNRRAVIYKKHLIDGGTATFYGHVFSHIPDVNACLGCYPMPDKEREDLGACTLVGIPRKKSHCLLKGQLYFESENDRLPDAANKKEVQVVLDYANNLLKEHFAHEPLYTMDDVVANIDHHEPSIITINAVISAIQSQDALRLLHQIKGIDLGSKTGAYLIYNGLTSQFFSFEKPRKKSCEVCGTGAPRLARLKVKSSTTMDQILHVLRSKGFKYEDDMPPMFWRIDSMNMEMLELEETIGELKIRNKELLMINGIMKEGSDKDNMYLQVLLD